jgi:hypothetical protein
MLIKEYRIPLPLSLEEVRVGLPFTVVEASRLETSGGEGVEIVEIRPFEDDIGSGIFSHKILHLSSYVLIYCLSYSHDIRRLPLVLQALVPASALEIHEQAWNQYPYCRTGITFDGASFKQKSRYPRMDLSVYEGQIQNLGGQQICRQ